MYIHDRCNPHHHHQTHIMSSKASSTGTAKRATTKTTAKKAPASEFKASSSTEPVEKSEKPAAKVAEKVAPVAETPKKEAPRRKVEKKQVPEPVSEPVPDSDGAAILSVGGQHQTTHVAQPQNVENYIDDMLLRTKNESKALREYTKLLHEMRRVYNAQIKELKKNKGKRQVSKGANRNPSGFASSSRIREPLCDFLNLEHGSKIARTIVTKRVIEYIKGNDLEQEGNRRNINPDDALENLVGGPEERLRTMKEKKKQLEEEAVMAMESTTMSEEKKIKKRKKADNCFVTEILSYFNLQVHLNKQFIKEEKKPKAIASAAEQPSDLAEQAAASA